MNEAVTSAMGSPAVRGFILSGAAWHASVALLASLAESGYTIANTSVMDRADALERLWQLCPDAIVMRRPLEKAPFCASYDGHTVCGETLQSAIANLLEVTYGQ